MSDFEKDHAVRGAEAEAQVGTGVDNTSREVPESIEIDHNGTAGDVNGAPEEKKAEGGKPPGEAQEKERSRAKIALIMSALCMAVFLAAIDITIITTAVPTIAEHFHSSTGYTWIGSAYLLAVAAATPLWGKISDIWGRKPVLLLANSIFFVGSLIAGLSTNIGMLIAARAIQGIGGGGLVILVNICISDLFSMRRRAAYFGVIGMVWAVASAVGPLVGGAFTEKASWRWCFYINLPLDGAAFLIILFFLDLHTPKTPLWDGLKAIDWIGSLSIVGGTLMLLFGLEFGGVEHPWNSAEVICLIVFGILTLALFFVNEWRLASYPIMPLRLFATMNNLAALGVCFMHGFVFIAGSYYLPLYFQAVLGATPLLSGVYVLPTALSLSLASAITGVFIRKTGLYLPPIIFGLFLMTLGYGLFIDLDKDSSWAKIIIYQIIAGIGTGPNFQSPLIALQAGVKGRDIATATATFGFVRNLATSISVVIGGVVFQNEMIKRKGMLADALGPQAASQFGGGSAGANVQAVDALPPSEKSVARVAFADSLRTMWIVYTAFAALGLALAFLIRKQSLTKTHEETKTGLETERENKKARDESRDRRRTKGLSVDGKGKDIEAGRLGTSGSGSGENAESERGRKRSGSGEGTLESSKEDV